MLGLDRCDPLLHGEESVRAAGLVLLAIAAFLQGLLGHGAATDPWTTAALGLHVLAAGLWLGALPSLLAACLLRPAQAPALARRFTPLGLACVAVLAVTSILQAQMFIGTLPGLLGTDYGKFALAKLALFGGLLLLAAANRFRFVPSAETSGSTRALALSITAETGLGLATVAVAAALASEPPAIHEQPIWPFALGPIPAFWDDAYLRDGLSRLLAPVAIALALFALATLVQKLRWPALLAGAITLAFISSSALAPLCRRCGSDELPVVPDRLWRALDRGRARAVPAGLRQLPWPGRPRPRTYCRRTTRLAARSLRTADRRATRRGIVLVDPPRHRPDAAGGAT
ncbi:CopD family protein [Bosea sp. F3-2]|uniref:copper resistance D family protein n=1 Tax=Bosea sp. F3-2 TaxID=2599640 RepID=UPI001654C655|nr:CopD family protein [Bosea sp. F3-2]